MGAVSMDPLTAALHLSGLVGEAQELSEPEFSSSSFSSSSFSNDEER